MTESKVRELLHERIAEAGGQRAFAAAAGVSPQYVNDVMRERRDLGDSILRALGLKRVVTYESAAAKCASCESAPAEYEAVDGGWVCSDCFTPGRVGGR
jgi:DNA-binding transcriptional regulator YdaS (Cro superfamily)